MAIVDNYAAIAAELRRIESQRRPQPGEVIRARTQVAYITRRGPVRISIEPEHPLVRSAAGMTGQRVVS